MRKQRRKILLFIDDCSAHFDLPNLKNVTVHYPSKNTSILQPLDQGIIRNFKVHYRRQVVIEYVLVAIDESKNPAITVLQAMRMASMAWHSITPITISNCFRKCGFPVPSATEIEGAAEHDDFALWDQVREALSVTEDITFSYLLNVDDAVLTNGPLEDEEIINQVHSSLENGDDGVENNDEEAIMRKDDLQYVQYIHFVRTS